MVLLMFYIFFVCKIARFKYILLNKNKKQKTKKTNKKKQQHNNTLSYTTPS